MRLDSNGQQGDFPCNLERGTYVSYSKGTYNRCNFCSHLFFGASCSSSHLVHLRWFCHITGRDAFPCTGYQAQSRNISKDNGRDLLRATYQIFNQNSFFKLIAFPLLMKRLMGNLIDFNVPYADLFKTKVTEISQQARAVLGLEESASIEKYPSVRSLLRFFPGPLTIATCRDGTPG
ncbi:hypothetical protein AMTRI_Chr04g246760 [Amborella trichopoda]